MNRIWIALAAIVIAALLTLSPYTVAPILALGYAAQRTEPAWVAIPPETRVFSASEDTTPFNAARSVRLDLFSNLSLPALKAFYQHDLAARGFTVDEESMGNITPAVAEMIGATGRLRAARKSDGTAIIVSFASAEGLLRKSRLFNIVWRIGVRT
jgi:hypothetical protein